MRKPESKLATGSLRTPWKAKRRKGLEKSHGGLRFLLLPVYFYTRPGILPLVRQWLSRRTVRAATVVADVHSADMLPF